MTTTDLRIRTVLAEDLRPGDHIVVADEVRYVVKEVITDHLATPKSTKITVVHASGNLAGLPWITTVFSDAKVDIVAWPEDGNDLMTPEGQRLLDAAEVRAEAWRALVVARNAYAAASAEYNEAVAGV